MQNSELEAENNALQLVLQTYRTMDLVLEGDRTKVEMLRTNDLVVEGDRTKVDTDRPTAGVAESVPVVAKGESQKTANARRRPPRKRHRRPKKRIPVYTEFSGLSMAEKIILSTQKVH